MTCLRHVNHGLVRPEFSWIQIAGPQAVLFKKHLLQNLEV
jgi:hypothetical protein